MDPGQTVEHIERITQLILDICGTAATQCGPIDDIQISLPPVVPVTLRVARAVKVIGMPLTQAQCADALKRLGLPVTEGPGTLTVLPPSYRFDLQIEEDLIEEVVRMVGYEQLPATPPLAPISARIRPEAERSPFAVRRTLAALGYQETINFSFVEERWEHELAGNANPIKLLNPIASQMSVMRSSLVGSLVQVLKFNLDRKASRVRVFELGRVFLRSPQTQSTDTTVAGFDQPMRVAGLAYGALDSLGWSRTDRNVDFFDIKGDVETLLAPLQAVFEPATHPSMHPGRCASVSVQGRQIGFVGELHPQWRQGYELAQAPVLFELELEAVLQRRVPQFSSVSKHQPVERDLAVIVSETVTHSALMAAINSAGISQLLRSATLFDVYRPQQAGASMQLGEKSLAVRLVLSSDEATLTEEQIEAAVKAVVARLQIVLGARLRA